jgi:hypothetical protein
MTPPEKKSNVPFNRNVLYRTPNLKTCVKSSMTFFRSKTNGNMVMIMIFGAQQQALRNTQQKQQYACVKV